MPEPTAIDSSQRGYMLPGPGIFRFTYALASDLDYWPPSAPQDGETLENFLQQLVAGITNLPPNLVRPRWQEFPPPIPPHNVDWAAVGINSADLDAGWPYVNYWPQDGQVYMQQHETFDMLVSCYGKRAEWYSGLIRDGFRMAQNLEPLFLAGMGLIDIGRGYNVSEWINQRWLMRFDRTVRIHRSIQRAYPVLTLLAAPGVVRVDSGPAPDVYESAFEAKLPSVV